MLLGALIEWLMVAAIVGLVGGLALHVMLRRSEPARAILASAHGRLRRWLAGCSAVACAGSVLWLVSATPNSPDGRQLALGVARIALTALATILIWRRGEWNWPIVLMGGSLALSHSLLSRAAGLDDWVAAVLVDWAHLCLTALWLGGVAALAVAYIPPVLANRSLTESFSCLVDRFSPLAVFCVIGLGVSGLMQGSAFIGGIEQLITTGYGRALTVKLILAAVLVGFGALHQQVIAPKLRLWRLKAARDEAERATARFQLSLWAEVATGLVLLAAVGVMKAFETVE